jgi:hypothetical protein
MCAIEVIISEKKKNKKLQVELDNIEISESTTNR